METEFKTLYIAKKGRKYFQCTLSSGYNCRLLIDEVTTDLPAGKEHDLEVEDLSVKTRFGTRLIFRAINVDKETE